MPSILPKVAEVLLQFALSYPNPFREWMEKLLIQDDFLCGNVMEAERREFLKTLLGSRQLKRYREAVKTFSIKCRGLEGTAFGGAF